MHERAIPAVADAGEGAIAQHASFEEFFERERDRLFSALFVVTRNVHEAEEIAQDAFLAVWERWDDVRDLDRPAGYLTNTAMNLFRKRYRRAQVLRRLLPSSKTMGVQGSADSRFELSEALGTLTPSQRAALVLTEILGYSAAEAGQLLKIKPSTVGALKYQARATLNESEPTDG